MRNIFSEIVGGRLARSLEKEDSPEGETQLARGIKVEREHEDLYRHLCKKFPDLASFMTLDEFAEWITKAHLRELDDYYTRLDKMEAEGKAEKK
jgi:hypothetical protein